MYLERRGPMYQFVHGKGTNYFHRSLVVNDCDELYRKGWRGSEWISEGRSGEKSRDWHMALSVLRS